jgi:hypothetical protein
MDSLLIHPPHGACGGSLLGLLFLNYWPDDISKDRVNRLGQEPHPRGHAEVGLHLEMLKT